MLKLVDPYQDSAGAAVAMECCFLLLSLPVDHLEGLGLCPLGNGFAEEFYHTEWTVAPSSAPGKHPDVPLYPWENPMSPLFPGERLRSSPCCNVITLPFGSWPSLRRRSF